VDARRFEALLIDARRKLDDDPATAARTFRDALAMWRGEPLADLAHELSLQPEIERLSGLRLAAIEDRIEVELALGRHAELAAELEGLTAEHPLRERLCGHLMLALYRAGRQAEALNAYHRLREALGSELGLNPSAAIEALQRRILTQDPSLDLRGTPLRGYRTVAVIAAGPVAEVRRGIEPQSQRDVAIKVLPAAIANDPQFIRRFDADASRVARLEHPHIVPLHDWWREPDAAYLVTRLMHRDLPARLAEGQVGSATGLRWAEQIGSALVAAHRQGVVHGDLHAGNVLVDEEDNAYVGDWCIGYDPAMSGTSTAVPSDRRHLAPERMSGTPPSSAADIYAFGVLLADLLMRVTGRAAGAELRPAVDQATDPEPERRQASAADLVAAARRALLEPVGEPVGARGMMPASRNPYRGLTAFEEADAADFFGRENLVRQLVRRIAEPGLGAGLLAAVGPSGSGKSSVVHAGLIPALRDGALAGSEEWLIATMTPTDHPYDMLERALLGVAVDTPTALGDVLASDGGLATAMERVLPRGAHLLLVLDQFEELFTLVSDRGERDRFLDLLAESIDAAASDLTVVVTLRADFYDRPLRHERFGRLLAERTVPVPAMDPEELERVVSAPARRAGVGLDPGLVARIIAEMREQPAGLPLLQYALTELWERREGPSLSLRAYDPVGASEGRSLVEPSRSFETSTSMGESWPASSSCVSSNWGRERLTRRGACAAASSSHFEWIGRAWGRSSIASRATDSWSSIATHSRESRRWAWRTRHCSPRGRGSSSGLTTPATTCGSNAVWQRPAASGSRAVEIQATCFQAAASIRQTSGWRLRACSSEPWSGSTSPQAWPRGSAPRPRSGSGTSTRRRSSGARSPGSERSS
jgi:hypothetical protein